MRALRRTIAVALAAALVSAYATGVLPCSLVPLQPACELIVSGGPVLDTTELLVVRPRDGAPVPAAVRVPAGTLLATTIEVSEPDSFGDWVDARRDPDRTLVPRARVVPPGGGLQDVALEGRLAMESSRERAVALALHELGLVTRRDAPPGTWPVTVTFATDGVGGPSAGMMLALAVVAQLAPRDPTALVGGGAGGLVVAGTGALDPAGRVVAVGGVSHKLRAAATAGRGGGPPDAFLVPVADLAAARRAQAGTGVLLVPVADLAQAVAALGELAAGRLPAGAER